MIFPQENIGVTMKCFHINGTAQAKNPVNRKNFLSLLYLFSF